jgi:hypothetical protein
MNQRVWLQLNWSEVRVVFNFSASHKLIVPSSPKLLPMKSENEGQVVVQEPLRLIYLRDEFTLSVSDNTIAASLSILLPVLSENGIEKQVCYC